MFITKNQMKATGDKIGMNSRLNFGTAFRAFPFKILFF
ncbi:hypothetical protein LEP1GSC193_0957 [Leptospira alstonii serovar Pingchang str. 80-412]|uniref:Uncharacterized protein n=2 Tax=Leptospira alstonii TaxID=28452 RepID=M6CRK3_9LEPT|nr:hypothetical protein LEP1GSC194_0646 [Leptospira alstonii serovar Sichuan str. 79601]EQA82414.1 hypothetical protein LEP1GSC193_0957 [Leptospira alstonii serovar Pingchang str. 80-412]